MGRSMKRARLRCNRCSCNVFGWHNHFFTHLAACSSVTCAAIHLHTSPWRCLYLCIHVTLCKCTHGYIGLQKSVCWCGCVHTCLCVRLQTRTHVCVCVSLHAFVCVLGFVCSHVRVRACAGQTHMCVFMWENMFMHECLHICLPGWLCAACSLAPLIISHAMFFL